MESKHVYNDVSSHEIMGDQGYMGTYVGTYLSETGCVKYGPKYGDCYGERHFPNNNPPNDKYAKERKDITITYGDDTFEVTEVTKVSYIKTRKGAMGFEPSIPFVGSQIHADHLFPSNDAQTESVRKALDLPEVILSIISSYNRHFEGSFIKRTSIQLLNEDTQPTIFSVLTLPDSRIAVLMGVYINERSSEICIFKNGILEKKISHEVIPRDNTVYDGYERCNKCINVLPDGRMVEITQKMQAKIWSTDFKKFEKIKKNENKYSNKHIWETQNYTIIFTEYCGYTRSVDVNVYDSNKISSIARYCIPVHTHRSQYLSDANSPYITTLPNGSEVFHHANGCIVYPTIDNDKISYVKPGCCRTWDVLPDNRLISANEGYLVIHDYTENAVTNKTPQNKKYRYICEGDIYHQKVLQDGKVIIHSRYIPKSIDHDNNSNTVNYDPDMDGFAFSDDEREVLIESDNDAGPDNKSNNRDVDTCGFVFSDDEREVLIDSDDDAEPDNKGYDSNLDVYTKPDDEKCSGQFVYIWDGEVAKLLMTACFSGDRCDADILGFKDLPGGGVQVTVYHDLGQVLQIFEFK